MNQILTQFSLSTPQRDAVLARGTDVVVTAGAGTGKTRTLVARYLSLLADGISLRQIVAITFTRKAAQEMRNRVRQELGTFLQSTALDPAERTAWRERYNGLDAARIGTIHTLCGEILRTHPAEAGIDPHFSVLEEGLSNLLRAEAVNDALGWTAEDPDTAALFTLFDEHTLTALLEMLLRERLAAAEVFARLDDAQPEDLLRAWQDALVERQSALLTELLGNEMWQAHVATLRRCRPLKPDDRMAKNQRLALTTINSNANSPLAARLRNLAALDEIDLRGGSAKAWPGGAAEKDEVKAALRGLRDQWRNASGLLGLKLNELDVQLAEALPHLRAAFSRAADTYRRLKAERDSLDFDDLEDLALKLLREDTAVRSLWQSTVQALLVDEFQDTNQRQLDIIRLLAPEPGKLFIVGDAKQSIYRFRRADVTVFRREQDHIADKGGSVHRLETSYRAHTELVADLNALLRPVLGEPGANVPAYVAPFAPLAPGRHEALSGVVAPFVELHLTVGSKADGALVRAAQALVARLAALVADSQLSWGGVAILCRASTSFGAYEDALDAADIPYITVAGRGFYQRPEIRDVLNALQAIADPSDDLALAGLLRSPACGLTDLALFELDQARDEGSSLWQTLRAGVAFSLAADDARWTRAVALVEQLSGQVGRTAVADLLKQFLDESDYRAVLRGAGAPRAVRNVNKLLDDAHRSGLVSVGAFLEYVTGLRNSGSREGEARATADGAVQIMSVHAAKGLEFPVVVIGDATYYRRGGSDVLIDPALGLAIRLETPEKTKPALYELALQYEQWQDAAESDRLLYVAATRAEELLLVNGCISVRKNSAPSQLDGWLGQLAPILGLDRCDLSGYDEEGDSAHALELEGAPVHASAVVYEPGWETAVTTPSSSVPPTPAPIDLDRLAKQMQPITPRELVVSRERPAPTVEQVVTPDERPLPSRRIVGDLVHKALELWRFPDAATAAWLRSQAGSRGLSEATGLDAAVGRVLKLLARFRAHALFREIDGADVRLHEVPYSLVLNGQASYGRIDLLYKREDTWTIVDFKTEAVRDASALRTYLEKREYVTQVRDYGTAIAALYNFAPRLLICLLDVEGRVHLEPVTFG